MTSPYTVCHSCISSLWKEMSWEGDECEATAHTKRLGTKRSLTKPHNKLRQDVRNINMTHSHTVT